MWGIHMSKTHCTHVWTSKNKFKSLKIAKKSTEWTAAEEQCPQWPLFSACTHISADIPILMTHTNMPTCRNSSLSHTNVLGKLTVQMGKRTRSLMIPSPECGSGERERWMQEDDGRQSGVRTSQVRGRRQSHWGHLHMGRGHGFVTAATILSSVTRGTAQRLKCMSHRCELT